MPARNLTAAFNRFGTKLVNLQWAVSAMNDNSRKLPSIIELQSQIA